MLYPHTETRRVALRAASIEDAPKVYEILFRLGRSNLPLIDTFVETFGRGLAAGLVIYRRDTDELVGYSTLSELDQAGHLRVEVNLKPGHPDEIFNDAQALTTNFAFSNWRNRKVYFHSTDRSVDSLGFGEHSVMVQEEAVLPDHTYFHGRLWDVYVFAIYRDQWDEHGVDLLKQIV